MIHDTKRGYKTTVSLTKLMVLHDLLGSTVAKQILFDQQDSKSISNVLWIVVTKQWSPISFFWLETLDTISFN